MLLPHLQSSSYRSRFKFSIHVFHTHTKNSHLHLFLPRLLLLPRLERVTKFAIYRSSRPHRPPSEVSLTKRVLYVADVKFRVLFANSSFFSLPSPSLFPRRLFTRSAHLLRGRCVCASESSLKSQEFALSRQMLRTRKPRRSSIAPVAQGTETSTTRICIQRNYISIRTSVMSEKRPRDSFRKIQMVR